MFLIVNAPLLGVFHVIVDQLWDFSFPDAVHVARRQLDGFVKRFVLRAME